MSDTATTKQSVSVEHAFKHDALFYAGLEEFLRAAVPFIRNGVTDGEAVMVAVSADKIASLREALGTDADAVTFADMVEIGRNPALIIEAWHDFIADAVANGLTTRGIGEPAWAERTPAELRECAHHEALLNHALANAPCWLLCPYDISTLDDSVIESALTNHPFVVDGDGRRDCPEYRDMGPNAFAERLPAAPDDAEQHPFDLASLHALRRIVKRRAAEAGFGSDRAIELAIAVSEIGTNSVVYGGGHGTLLIWHEGSTLVIEVRDGGHIRELLVGRLRPEGTGIGGYGLWLANRLSDLSQVRSDSSGTVIRLHNSLSHSV